ncbi:cbb3-type cytochrome c oxidase subunit I [Flavobacterium sp. SM2513]|uniref:cbb3-type cytochrome c oxidase subunit I n=1 Tax=Flavobacterium sp. SM2513 TaxID=3424766 RepID=UPI003D7F53BC
MKNTGLWFIRIAFVLLIAGLLFGHLASESYNQATATNGILGFLSLRPLHVSCAYLGIISAGIGFISIVLQKIKTTKLGQTLQYIQLALWVLALTGIFYSYFTGNFGGREYWEFDPVWAVPLFLSFIIFLIYFLYQVERKEKWPVYQWMWLTGIIFFIFTFVENYLWVFPYFRSQFITDMTIQWKVNGSLVGAVNQMIYGVAFYLMEKISGNNKSSFQKLSYAFYFLGLFNLMFNWGHHIYLLPTEKYIHYIAYAVSMTEWIILLRIFYKWSGQIKENKQHYFFFPYRFLMAADYWVIINLTMGIFMSIPAFNLYLHGTHIIVAHAMGTTIGINVMIILAAGFYFLKPSFIRSAALKFNSILFWIVQGTLFLFLSVLIGMGVHRGIWQAGLSTDSFSEMMDCSLPWFLSFIAIGLVLMLSMGYFFVYLLIKTWQKNRCPAG